VIVVPGIDALRTEHGRLFVTVGVFDGLHRGHLYLLDALRAGAADRQAAPAVITFDHHPDEIVTGSAPPLLLDPGERLERLEAAGVAVTIVQHFDRATRETPFDAFVRRLAARVDLAGFLMTPDSAFGYERRGTPDAVARLGRELGYDVEVIPPLEIDGRPVRSTDIRHRIATGDLAGAATLLGRPYAVVADVDHAGRASFPVPVALPPAGEYVVADAGRSMPACVDRGTLELRAATGPTSRRRVRLTFEAGPSA
jgi:riboflavin kinase/FMN adenylyltransferase